MVVVTPRKPSNSASNALSVATVALKVAGAATDAVPIAKQILNSAAHICAAAERIQQKREAMYLLVEKAEMYATQINQAVAGFDVDASLQRRLGRLHSVFVKIETLVNDEVDGKNAALMRVWRNVISKPNHAEALLVELDREIQLFHILTEIHLSTDVKYDGQFRRLRDCDIEKLDIIHKRETDEGVVVWASARVEGQLMVIRYLESHHNAKSNTMTTLTGSSQPWDAYHEYLENVKKVSTVYGSHPHIVQLYGLHIQGPAAVFRSGTLPLHVHLCKLYAEERKGPSTTVHRLRLVRGLFRHGSVQKLKQGQAFKILDASYHLEDAHGLTWIGESAIVDENGEPRIGLFDDIVRVDPDHSPSGVPLIYWNIFGWFDFLWSKDTGVVDQVHDTYLHAVITEQFACCNGVDRLQHVWHAIRQEPLQVEYYKRMFPIISGNLLLSQELIARARLYFETSTKKDDSYWNCLVSFVRQVLAGGGSDMSSRRRIYFQRLYASMYSIHVDTCTHNNRHIRWDRFSIYIPTGCPLGAEVARVLGLPDDFEHSWDGSEVYIYPQFGDKGEHRQGENGVCDGEGANNHRSEKNTGKGIECVHRPSRVIVRVLVL